MAEKYALDFVLRVDGKAAKGGLKSFLADLKRELNKDFKISLSFPNSKSVSNRLGRMTARLQAFNNELERLSRYSTAASSGLLKIAAGTQAASSTMKDLTTSAKQSQKVLQGNAVVINEGASAMERLGAQTALTARRYAGFVVASRFLFGFERSLEDAISSALDFNTQLVKVAQVTDLPIKAMAALKAEIGDLAVEFATPADDLNQAAITLAQAGFSFAKTKKILSEIAPTTLAATFGDINETVDGTIAILNQFNIESTKTAKVLDTLNILAAKYPAEVKDLFEIVKRSGAVFSAASGVQDGVKDSVEAFQELAAIGTVVRSTTRLNATQIGTSLKTIFSRIQSPEVIEDLRSMNIELLDMNKNFVGPIEALRRIDEQLAGVSKTSVKFQSVAQSIGGLRQADKTIALLSNLQEVLNALDVAKSGSDTVIDDARQAMEDLGNRLKSLKEDFNSFIREVISSSSFQGIANGFILIGKTFLDVARALGPLTPALTAIAGFKGVSGLLSFAKGFAENIKYTNANTQALAQNTQTILGLTKSLGFSSATAVAARVPRRASGGIVRGPGGSTEDNILTAISNGEYVISAAAVKKVGLPFLNTVNAGKIPKFAKGGLPGGGVTAGKLGPLLKEALKNENIDFSNNTLVIQAGKGAEGFGLNPDAIQRNVIEQLKKGIDPRIIRSTLLDTFKSIRQFADTIPASKLPTGNGVFSTPADLITPQSLLSLSRNPNLPIIDKNVPVPNPQLINQLPIGLPAPEQPIVQPTPTRREVVKAKLAKQRQIHKSRAEFFDQVDNPPIIQPTRLSNLRNDFIRDTVPFGSQSIAEDLFTKISKRVGVDDLDKLESKLKDRVDRIRSKAGVSQAQADALGQTTFGKSSAGERISRVRDRLVSRGFSTQDATELATSSLDRPRAGQRLGNRVRNVKNSLANRGRNLLAKTGPKNEALQRKIGGAALTGSLLLQTIPTEQGSIADILKNAGSAGFFGASIGSAIPGIGTAAGAGIGATIGAGASIVSSLNQKSKDNFSKRVDDFSKALEGATKDSDKLVLYARLFREGAIQADTFFNKQGNAQRAFGELEGSLDGFAKVLASKAMKSGAKSLEEFVNNLDATGSDLETINDILSLAKQAGVKLDLHAIVDKNITSQKENIAKAISQTINTVIHDVLVRDLNALSQEIQIATSSISVFTEQTDRLTREGLGNFSPNFDKLSIGTGSFGEIQKLFPDVERTVPGQLLVAQDILKNELNSKLLTNAFNDPNKLEGSIRRTTNDVRIPAPLRNNLRVKLDETLAGLDDATPTEKFQALSDVLTEFANDPAFDAARQAIQAEVDLRNAQNAAIAGSVQAFIELSDAQRKNEVDALNIRIGAGEFDKKFTQRFPDLDEAITDAGVHEVDRFVRLFPSVPTSNPKALGTAITDERRKLDALKANPVANADAIRTSSDKLNQLTKALEFVRDSVDKLTAIENRLVEINQNRQNAVDFAERIATASPDEIAAINSQIGSVRKFEAGGKLTATETKSALEILDQLGKLDDNVLSQFGRSREDIAATREKIIGSRFGRTTKGGEAILGAFAKPPGKSNEEIALRTQAENINEERAKAAEELAKLNTQGIANINASLQAQLKNFENQNILIAEQAKNLEKLTGIADKFAAIPKEITLGGNIKVDVNLNNGQILDKLDPFIRQLVKDQIDAALLLENKKANDQINGN